MKRRDFITQSLGTTLLAVDPSMSALCLRLKDKIEKSCTDNIIYEVMTDLAMKEHTALSIGHLYQTEEQ